MAPAFKRAERRSKRAGGGFASRWFTGRTGTGILLLALLCLAGIGAFPLSTGATRLTGAILAGVLAAGLLARGWRHRFLRWVLLIVYLAAGIFVFLPGRTGYDRIALRYETAHAAGRYEGARYVWGGENYLGIDCSGLVRRGAIDALFISGVRTVNPLLVRKAAELWWHDLSAQELGHGAGGRAQKLVEIKAIAGMDDSKLHPGDFAITQSGSHALAYLGDHQWVEADPGEGRVIRINGRSTTNPWFHQPVSIMRWRFLDLPQLVGRRP